MARSQAGVVYTRSVGGAVASEEFDRSSVRRILGISDATLRSWERVGLAQRKDRYTFTDLVAFRTLQGLRQNNIPARRIKESLEQLRLRLASVDQPLDQLKIESDGRRITVVLPEETVEAMTGQVLFRFDVGTLRSVTELEPVRGRGGFRRPKPNAEDCFTRALQLEHGNAPDEDVIVWYERALQENPEARGALINLGAAQLRQGEHDSAARSFRRAIRLGPDHPMAHYNLGAVRESQGRADEAAAHYRDALRCDPDYADAHFNLAQLEQERGRITAATKHWDAYLQLDSGSPWATIARSKLEGLRMARRRAAGGPSGPIFGR